MEMKNSVRRVYVGCRHDVKFFWAIEEYRKVVKGSAIYLSGSNNRNYPCFTVS